MRLASKNQGNGFELSIQDMGLRIKKRREHIGWSQDTLGRRIGKDQATISRLENPRQMPPPEILNPVAQLLELDLLTLLATAGYAVDAPVNPNPYRYSDELREIAARLQRVLQNPGEGVDE